MDVVVDAKVRSLGEPYADGTPRLEINLPAAGASGLAFVRPDQTDIVLRINGVDYAGSVLANKPSHDTVWFSPTLTGPGGERDRLGRVLTDAGFRANDNVRLLVTGLHVTVVAAGAGPADRTTAAPPAQAVQRTSPATAAPPHPPADIAPRVEIIGTVTTRSADPAGRMQRTKLVLEIVAVAVTVISGVVALVLRFWS